MLVRRVKQGSTWHQANDNLRGTDVYGTYGTPVSDSSFSVRWQSWGSELLLTTGKINLEKIFYIQFVICLLQVT